MNRFLGSITRNGQVFKPLSSCKLNTLTHRSLNPNFATIKTAARANVYSILPTKRIGLVNAITTKCAFQTPLLLNTTKSLPVQSNITPLVKYSGTRAFSTHSNSNSFHPLKKIWQAIKGFGYRWYFIGRAVRIAIFIAVVFVLALIFGTILKYILYALLLYGLYRFGKSAHIHWKYSKFFHYSWPYVTKYRSAIAEEVDEAGKPYLILTPIKKLKGIEGSTPQVVIRFFPWKEQDFYMEIVGEPKKGMIEESNINKFWRKADYLYVKSVSIVPIRTLVGGEVVYNSEDDHFSMDPETKIQTEGLKVLEGEVVSEKKHKKKRKD
eukprot:TRINITY_DN8142_c0_g2_i1.p1 TRINITY_DN8142_c0_g2~~TRINITY_DN8142_c0_g2_i1.p1  ORF type:complete len:323 (+),score=47.76 TRINITY_DN8142_c0_g2_i1:221-1189(+)